MPTKNKKVYTRIHTNDLIKIKPFNNEIEHELMMNEDESLEEQFNLERI